MERVSEPQMRSDADPAVPAKFSLDMIGTRLIALETGQTAMNGVLGLMLDTLQVQTHLLRKLTEYAREEPSSSPVAKVLGELTAVVTQIDDSVTLMGNKFENLSAMIATAFEIEAEESKPTPVNGTET